MSVIVTDGGFAKDEYEPLAEAASLGPNRIASLAQLLDAAPSGLANTAPLGVLIENDVDLDALTGHFEDLALIAVRFPSFADGRGFSVARRLRAAGYRGRLRAVGHVIVDQYAYARLCGFDEIQIDADLAARQPEAQWRAAATQLQAPSYRDKLTRTELEERKRRAA